MTNNYIQFQFTPSNDVAGLLNKAGDLNELYLKKCCDLIDDNLCKNCTLDKASYCKTCAVLYSKKSMQRQIKQPAFIKVCCKGTKHEIEEYFCPACNNLCGTSLDVDFLEDYCPYCGQRLYLEEK